MINDTLVSTLLSNYPDRSNMEFSSKEIRETADSIGMNGRKVYQYVHGNCEKVRHGVYSLSSVVLPFKTTTSTAVPSKKKEMASITSITNDEVFVPQVDSNFVAWGHSSDLTKIIKSKVFYPVYISGLSGNGKTMMAEQACAKAKREYIRVQVTPETDEDDLIGGFRLIDGDTVFCKGPVIKAMEKGAILLIDEIDRGSNKLMCLQGVLEGKPVLIKKTGEVIHPAHGFNVIATANTKGKGSDDGRFISATIIDEAFLERFTITLEQPYPSQIIERNIVMNHMSKFECVDEDFANSLTVWSEAIRKTFMDGGVDELISTRRLCHIVQTFSIFKDRKKSIDLCISRFDQDTKEAFLDLFSKVDAKEEVQPQVDSDSIDDIIDSI